MHRLCTRSGFRKRSDLTSSMRIACSRRRSQVDRSMCNSLRLCKVQIEHWMDMGSGVVTHMICTDCAMYRRSAGRWDSDRNLQSLSAVPVVQLLYDCEWCVRTLWGGLSG